MALWESFRFGLLLMLLGLSVFVQGQPESSAVSYVHIPETGWVSALATATGAAQQVQLSPFAVRAHLVTVREFEAFVLTHPYWQKGRGSMLLHDASYLENWVSAAYSGLSDPEQRPVTWVSWYAAHAFCASEGAHLPTWFEWERVGAASTTKPDAREDTGYAQHRLNQWLSPSASTEQASVTTLMPNFFGVYELHGRWWEWVEDYAALFPQADPRNPGSGGALALCGGSALGFADRRDYTLMLRIAALSAMLPAASSASIGFRCVRDGE